MFSRLLTALTITFVLLSTYDAVAQKTTKPEVLVDEIKRMRTAVVQICYTAEVPGNAAQPFQIPELAGTGFFVSQQAYLLTAAHVIRLAEAAGRARGATRIRFRVGLSLDSSTAASGIEFHGSFTFLDASPVEVDEVHDIALLKLSRNPFMGEVQSGVFISKRGFVPLTVSVATLKSSLPPEGRNVLISGYPLDIPTLVTQKGMVASESFSLVDVPTPGPRGVYKRPEAVDSILLDAVVNPGNSGGPVYEADSGEVIGICVAYKFSPLLTDKRHEVSVAPDEVLKQNSGLAITVPIKYAIDLLKKNGVKDFRQSNTNP